MIFRRPPNLVLGAITATFNAVVLALAALTPPVEIDAGVVGAINLAAAAIIALIANAPPTLAPGDRYNVSTPAGIADVSRTVAVREIGEDATGIPHGKRADDRP
jgi:hypothetical protein